MTYATGAASSPAALLSAILSFAQTDGWSDVSGSWPISAGSCHINASSVVRASQADYTTGVNVPDSKTQLVSTLGTSLPGVAPSPWYNMPGSIVSSDTDADIPYAWDIEAALISHHIFSGGGAGGDYVHVVMQTAAQTWTHFSFGNIDKKGLTHDGVGYLTACQNPTWPNTSTTSGQFNNPFFHNPPFTGSYGEPASSLPRIQYLAGNAVIAPYITGAIGNAPTMADIGMKAVEQGADAFTERGVNLSGRYLQHVYAQSPLPYNGNIVLSAVPCFLVDLTNVKMTYVGDFPGVRYCRMDGLSPGEEITFGGDTWKIFPITRQTNVSEVGQLYTVASGPLALAYKKVV